MDCQTFNEGTNKRIENFLNKTNTEENVFIETCFKSTYSPATLINNWSENRKSEENKKVLKEELVSEYMEKFKGIGSWSFPDRREYFNKIFDGYGYGQELLLDHLGFSYYGNYVSSYDLCYNHLTKGICGPYPRVYHKGEYKPSADLSLIYGNLTQWGLKEKIHKKLTEQESSKPILISESKSQYISYDLTEAAKLNNFPSLKRVKHKNK